MVQMSETIELTYQVQEFFRSVVNMNDIQTMKRLLRHHRDIIDVNATNGSGQTALQRATIQRNRSMISTLVKEGADVNKCDYKGFTPLHTAVSEGNFELCEYLLRKGADPMQYTLSEELPVDLSATSSITYLLVEMMQQRGYIGLARYHLSRAVSQQKNEIEAKQMPIHRSSSITSDENTIELNSILKRRPSKSKKINSVARCSWSSASSSTSTLSSVSDDSEVETLSVRSSTSSTSSTSSGLSVQFSTNTLFLNYVHENEYELLDRLLQDNEVSIMNKLDRKGLSTIHWASINGFDGCVRVLVKHGADVDIVDPNGWTPLHAAVITGKIECVKALLLHGASVYAVTNTGETVFDMTQDEEIRRQLEKNIKNSFSSGLRKSVL